MCFSGWLGFCVYGNPFYHRTHHHLGNGIILCFFVLKHLHIANLKPHEISWQKTAALLSAGCFFVAPKSWLFVSLFEMLPHFDGIFGYSAEVHSRIA